jgi:hypothetical protein
MIATGRLTRYHASWGDALGGSAEAPPPPRGHPLPVFHDMWIILLPSTEGSAILTGEGPGGGLPSPARCHSLTSSPHWEDTEHDLCPPEKR